MNTYRTHRNVHNALPSLLGQVLEDGIEHQSRNGPMLELNAQTVVLTNPYERFHTLTHRNANPAAQIAETLWVLAGRNDINWLSWYLPRAADYSDDGETWRAGYGPRLRAWPFYPKDTVGVGPALFYPVDQVRHVLDLLKQDPGTQRAVISLWDPALDYTDSKDVPCNNWLQFLVRNNCLNMLVVIRSNDLMWGWSGINTFEWSVLQEVLAHTLHLKVGSATYFIGSMHLYAPHIDRAKKIVQTYYDQAKDKTSPYAGNPAGPTLQLDLDTLDGWLKDGGWFWRHEAEIRRDPYAMNQIVQLYPTGDARISILRVLDVYARQQQHDSPPNILMEQALRISRKDMAHAAVEWLNRQYPKPRPVVVTDALPSVFELVTALQPVKDKLYGSSWKKYGEKGSIFPNIARKFDRLEYLSTHDHAANGETQLDTIIDLGVYATMYYGWLKDLPFADAVRDVQAAFPGARPDVDKLAMISIAFHDIARYLEMEEGDVDPLRSRTWDARTIACWCFSWAEGYRANNDPDYHKFIDYVREFTKEQTA